MARATKQAADTKEKYLESLSSDDTPMEDELAAFFGDDEPSTDFDRELLRERQLKNDDVEQDIKLKRRTLLALFVFLAVETALIFIFAFLQGTTWLQFHLDEWSFKLLIAATLSQVAAMLFTAVRYLFPKK